MILLLAFKLALDEIDLLLAWDGVLVAIKIRLLLRHMGSFRC